MPPFPSPGTFQMDTSNQGKKGKIRSGALKDKWQNIPISTVMFSSGKDKAFEPSK